MNIEKFTVCAMCLSVGVVDLDCICVHQKDYDTVELEFEVCECCNNLICDGQPAETDFNKKQLRE